MNDKSENTVFVNADIQQNMTENEDLDKLYMELGKAYYEGGYEDPLPQLLPLFDKITAMTGTQPGTAFPSASSTSLLKDASDGKEEAGEASLDSVRYCLECGAEIPEGARFCGICGTPIGGKTHRQNICAKCGSALDEDAAFCGNCGTPVNDK